MRDFSVTTSLPPPSSSFPSGLSFFLLTYLTHLMHISFSPHVRITFLLVLRSWSSFRHVTHMFYCNTVVTVRISVSGCLTLNFLATLSLEINSCYLYLSVCFSASIIPGIRHAEVSACVGWWRGYKDGKKEWYSLIGLKSFLLAVAS